MNQKLSLSALGSVCLLLISIDSSAYNFTPTESEWQAWASYCKARYVTTVFGRDTKFATRVNQDPKAIADLAQWTSAGINGIHHFCTGTIWLNRARLEQNPRNREGFLRNAFDETNFSYQASTDRKSLHFSKVAIQMATILNEQGEAEGALQILQRNIAVNPHNDVLYSAAASMQRKMGLLNQARDTLLQGDAATDGRSAEIKYNLGLISLELGDVDGAHEYARAAYEMGFPLPGLKQKLSNLDRD